LDAALQELEAAPVCQGLSLYSFLMLPMQVTAPAPPPPWQRVTRLPLLCAALLQHLAPGPGPAREGARAALGALTRWAAGRKEEKKGERRQTKEEKEDKR
jgi:hypothetical protein